MEHPNILYREKLSKACENARKQSQELLDLLVQASEKHVFTDGVLAHWVRAWESFNSVIREVERVNSSTYTPDNRRNLVDATSSIKCVIDALHSSLAKHNGG